MTTANQKYLKNGPCKAVRFFKRFYLFIFREGKGGRKRRRETSMCGYPSHALTGDLPASRACALSGNRTGDLFIRRPALNPLSHTSQGISFFINLEYLKMALIYHYTWMMVRLVFSSGCHWKWKTQHPHTFVLVADTPRFSRGWLLELATLRSQSRCQGPV